MARKLRMKIQETITKKDLLELQLQEYARNLLKEKTENQKIRKEFLYNLEENEEIQNLLKEEKLEEAKKLAESLIDKNQNY